MALQTGAVFETVGSFQLPNAETDLMGYGLLGQLVGVLCFILTIVSTHI